MRFHSRFALVVVPALLSACTPHGVASTDAGAVADAGPATDAGSPQTDAGPSHPNAPAWVNSLPHRTWTPLPGTEFRTNATPLIPTDSYRGSDPVGAMVDAYSDPTYDPTTHNLHFLGGGHGDGTCNAIVTLSLETLTYSLTVSPTPSTAYPPSYLQSPTPTYPSGLALDWFHTDAELSDAADKPYAAPFSAPLSTHEYGGQAVRYKSGSPREIQWFYLQHKVFDLDAKRWTNAHEQGIDFISQRVATQANAQYQDLGTNIGPTVPLQQGTMALYDDVTDSYFVTLVPGDAGGGWRTFFFRYDPTTQMVPKIYRPELPCRESMGWVRAGRWIYGVVTPFGVAYPNETLNTGFRFNIDTEAFEYFNITGDVVNFQTGTSQEAAPMWFDSSLGTFYTWNHNAQDRSGVYELHVEDLGQKGGSGTSAEPYNWPQKRIELGGTPPSQVTYRYNGTFYIPEWDVMVVMPASGQPLYALRM